MIVDILAFAGLGLVLGAVYFYLLDLTVRYLTKVKKPMRLLALSTISRFIVIGAVFYVLLKEYHWSMSLVVLGGFVIARFMAIKFEKKKGSKQ